MVHTSAAVSPDAASTNEMGSIRNSHGQHQELPSTHEPREQQHFISLASVQSDPSLLNLKSHKHRRHKSLFSSSSVDSGAATGHVGKSASGKFHHDWKLGDLWYSRKPSGKENLTEANNIANNSPTPSRDESFAEDRSEDGSSRRGLRKISETRKPHREWKIGDFWHTRRHESPHVKVEDGGAADESVTSEFKSTQVSRISVSAPVGDKVTTVTTKLDAETVNIDLSSNSEHSLHYTSLGVFTSSKFSSSDLEESADNNNNNGSSPPGSRLRATEKTKAPLSVRWREIQGTNNWEGLLDPLDLDLRREILRYGDFAQMAYDNFECDRHSKYAGSARFPKQKLLEKLYKANCGYQVTRYLYATCDNPLPGVIQSSLWRGEKWDVESNWMGFVAVATDPKEIERLGRRDIVVVWRGTMRTIEWLVDAQIQMAPMVIAPDPQQRGSASTSHHHHHAVDINLRPKVEKGFWCLYTSKHPGSQFNQKSASEQVIQELARLLTLYKGEPLSITLTGHSLGGALAALTAYEVAEKGMNKLQTQSAQGSTQETTVPVTLFTFGSPRMGDAMFRKRFEELQLKALRIVNVHDLVPKAIGGFHPPWGETYKHVGIELALNHKLSTHMKPTRDPLDWHNLECYLHHVDGYPGSNSKEFKLVTGRDPALINKAADILKDEFCVPPYWWQLENKGLVISAEGRWVEPNRPFEDTPSLENRDRFL